MIRTGTTYDEENKIWSGPKIQQLYHPDVSLGQVILEAFQNNPSKIAQIDAKNGSILTNNGLYLRTVRIAKALLRKNLGQGDVIGIVARNTENLAPVVFAALTCGYPINALDPVFGKGLNGFLNAFLSGYVDFFVDELLHMYGCTEPKIFFCDVSEYEKVAECVKELNLCAEIITINGEIKGVASVKDMLVDTEGEENNFIPPKLKRGGAEIAAMICTSGTTGNSKAVRLSHGLFLAQFPNLFHGNCDDVVFITSPLYWMTCWMCIIHCSVAGAVRVISDETFSPELFLRIIEKYKVTIVLTAPVFMMMSANSPFINEVDFSSVKVYMCTGCTLPESQINRMKAILVNGSMVGAYGMSEVGAYVTVQDPSFMKKGSVGKLVSNVQVKIVDENGKMLDVNEEGEIVIKISIPFSGYHKNDKDTKFALDENGWVYSGDIGYVDNDGYLFVIDRKKDLIKHKSYHVSPTEVESILLTLPGVKQACVVGIPHELYIELPAAAIVKSEHTEIAAAEVYDFIAARTSCHKHLEGGVYFVQDLPYTPSGKVQRRKVRDLLVEMFNKRNKE